MTLHQSEHRVYIRNVDFNATKLHVHNVIENLGFTVLNISLVRKGQYWPGKMATAFVTMDSLEAGYMYIYMYIYIMIYIYKDTYI